MLVGVLLVSVLAGVLQGILMLIPAALADGNEVALAVTPSSPAPSRAR